MTRRKPAQEALPLAMPPKKPSDVLALQLVLRVWEDGRWERVAQEQDMATRRYIPVAYDSGEESCPHKHCAWSRLGELAAEMAAQRLAEVFEGDDTPPPW